MPNGGHGGSYIPGPGNRGSIPSGRGGCGCLVVVLIVVCLAIAGAVIAYDDIRDPIGELINTTLPDVLQDATDNIQDFIDEFNLPSVPEQVQISAPDTLSTTPTVPAPNPTFTNTSTVAPPPTQTPNPSPTASVTPTPLPTPSPKPIPTVAATITGYLIEVIGIELLGNGQVDFLLEVRNDQTLDEGIAQLQMSVDGSPPEMVNIIASLPPGETASFAFAHSLAPGPHEVRFSVGDSHTTVSVNVEEVDVAVSVLTPTPVLAVISVPMLTATPLPTNTPLPTYTPAPKPTRTSVPTHTPKPTPTETATESSMDNVVEEIEVMVHTFVNNERKEYGLNELQWDSELGLVSRKHSEDMAQRGYFSHDSPNGDGPDERASKAGYHCLGGYYIGFGENIYQGWLYSSVSYGSGGTQYDWLTPLEIATKAVVGWMDSPGHRKNILKPRYIRSGVGVAVSKAGKVLFTHSFC